MRIACLKRLVLLLAVACALCACTVREPLRIGFLGGISGRVADLGISGRNGAMLAIDMRNATGGIHGRAIELVVEDDKQNPDIAKQSVARLIERKVEAIIGPMTSIIAMACLPQINDAKMTMVSPTVSTTQLSGIDDYFFRVISPTTAYAKKSADYHYTRLGKKRVAIAYDAENRAYTESWLADYRSTLLKHGGQIISTLPFLSSNDFDFSQLARQLLLKNPDAILMIANSVDTAMLAQQIRQLDSTVFIATSEWAATERLIELGGKTIEGLAIEQLLDRDSQHPAFLAFRSAYMARYAVEPSFGALAGFDAANVVLDALASRKKEQTLKQAILTQRVFTGAQSEIRFDDMGDAQRETFMFVVRNGSFVRQQ